MATERGSSRNSSRSSSGPSSRLGRGGSGRPSGVGRSSGAARSGGTGRSRKGAVSGPRREADDRRGSGGGTSSASRYGDGAPSQLPPPEPEVWIDEGVVEGSRRGGGGDRGKGRPASGSTAKTSSSRPRGSTKANVNLGHLADLVGPKRAERLAGRVASAAEAFEGGRFAEARQILAPIAKEVPEFPEVRELYGLILYRLGRWKEAAKELEAFIELSPGSTEQHPVLADCRRALKQYREVDRLWTELKEASPSGELVTEGRIVAAGALADQGELASAIRLLAQGFKFPKRPREHHLRRAYALADLYERSGDVPQARALFGRLAHADDRYLDASDRAIGLG